MYLKARAGNLQNAQQMISGPIKNHCTGHLQSMSEERGKDLFVVSGDLVMPLMGLPAIQCLPLLQPVAAVQTTGNKFTTMVHSLFSC